MSHFRLDRENGLCECPVPVGNVDTVPSPAQSSPGQLREVAEATWTLDGDGELPSELRSSSP